MSSEELFEAKIKEIKTCLVNLFPEWKYTIEDKIYKIVNTGKEVKND